MIGPGSRSPGDGPAVSREADGPLRRRRRIAMSYFTNAGPQSGPILGRHGHDAVAILQAPDDPTPIGTAVRAGSTEGGIALWTLTVGDAVLPGDGSSLGGSSGR